jgi:hypothetical protein
MIRNGNDPRGSHGRTKTVRVRELVPGSRSSHRAPTRQLHQVHAGVAPTSTQGDASGIAESETSCRMTCTELESTRAPKRLFGLRGARLHRHSAPTSARSSAHTAAAIRVPSAVTARRAKKWSPVRKGNSPTGRRLPRSAVTGIRALLWNPLWKSPPSALRHRRSCKPGFKARREAPSPYRTGAAE